MSHHADLGGDKTETMVCPGCGIEIPNTHWATHFRSDACDGEVDL